MSTRCMINFGETAYGKKLRVEAKLYQHSDGYPDGGSGVLCLMQRFFRAVEADTNDTRFEDPEYLAAKFVVWSVQEQRRSMEEWQQRYPPARERWGGKDGPLNFLSIGVSRHDHGDIAYSYFVDCRRHDENGRPLVLFRKRGEHKYRKGTLDMQAKLVLAGIDNPPPPPTASTEDRIVPPTLDAERQVAAEAAAVASVADAADELAVLERIGSKGAPR